MLKNVAGIIVMKTLVQVRSKNNDFIRVTDQSTQGSPCAAQESRIMPKIDDVYRDSLISIFFRSIAITNQQKCLKNWIKWGRKSQQK